MVDPIAYVRIPNLTQSQPIVDSAGRMTNEFLRRLNDILQGLGNAVNATAAAINAANAAQAAADSAQISADMAQAQADQAAAMGGETAREAAIQNSYISPASVLSDGGALINVAGHTRNYVDGTSVAVSGGTASYASTVAGTASYVFYDQPSRTGGTVTYQSSTTPPVQSGDRHVVGGIVYGNANGGRGPSPPGSVDPIP